MQPEPWPDTAVPIRSDDERAHYRRRSQLGAGFACIFVMSLVETFNADHIHPSPFSPYLWGALAFLSLASASYATICWRRSKGTPGQFPSVPTGMPHDATNPSATEPARVVVARNEAAEQDQVAAYPKAQSAPPPAGLPP